MSSSSRETLARAAAKKELEKRRAAPHTAQVLEALTAWAYELPKPSREVEDRVLDLLAGTPVLVPEPTRDSYPFSLLPRSAWQVSADLMAAAADVPERDLLPPLLIAWFHDRPERP